MASKFALFYNRLAESQFKQVPEGWLFTTSSPWLFWRWRTYRLTDAQKPAFVDAVRLGGRVSLVIVVALVTLLAAAFVRDPVLVRLDSVRSWTVILAFVAALAIGVHAGTHLPVRKLLREVPRADETVGRTEMLRATASAMSIKSLKLFTALFAFGAFGNATNALIQFEGGRMPLGFLLLFSTLFMTLLAIIYGGQLTSRLRARREVETDEPTLENLAARLAIAERRASYVPSTLAAFGVTLGLIVAFQVLDRTGSVSAKDITLRNDSGDIVAQVRTMKGEPWLFLYGQDKTIRASMGLEKDGNLILALRDAKGKTRWVALAGESGTRSSVLSAGGK